MRFDSLAISNLRCLDYVEFRPHESTNLICGANGTGKTSVLEGFALASLGKSFLSNRTRDLVRTGASGLAVRATLQEQGGNRFTVAVRKVGGETAINLDGQPVLAASTLAHRVPTLVINSKAADILTENPSNRRALIDRTLFHVEQDYVGAWKRYRHVLRQRNELLRRQAPRAQAEFWNAQLVDLADSIDSRRAQVVQAINAALVDNVVAERTGPLELFYSPGWNRELGYPRQLADAWTRDLTAGHTTFGVHRADLTLRGNGKAIAKRLSRGQGKFVVCSILIALAEFIERAGHRKPVLLVDDLAAELDGKMRARVVDMIQQRGGQTIYTAINPADLPEVAERSPVMFHVEQRVAGQPA